MPTDIRMNKQNVVMYNGILFNLKKEGDFDTCYNMWKKLEDIMLSKIKPVTKGKKLYDSSYIRNKS